MPSTWRARAKFVPCEPIANPIKSDKMSNSSTCCATLPLSNLSTFLTYKLPNKLVITLQTGCAEKKITLPLHVYNYTTIYIKRQNNIQFEGRKISAHPVEAYMFLALQKLHFLTRIAHKEIRQDLHFSNNRVRVALKNLHIRNLTTTKTQKMMFPSSLS